MSIHKYYKSIVDEKRLENKECRRLLGCIESALEFLVNKPYGNEMQSMIDSRKEKFGLTLDNRKFKLFK